MCRSRGKIKDGLCLARGVWKTPYTYSFSWQLAANSATALSVLVSRCLRHGMVFEPTTRRGPWGDAPPVSELVVLSLSVLSCLVDGVPAEPVTRFPIVMFCTVSDRNNSFPQRALRIRTSKTEPSLGLQRPDRIRRSRRARKHEIFFLSLHGGASRRSPGPAGRARLLALSGCSTGPVFQLALFNLRVLRAWRKD